MFILSLFAAFVSSSGLLGFVIEVMTLDRTMPVEKLMEDKTFIACVVAIAVYPVVICIELFFKGGDAGARLKDESVDRQTKIDDKFAKPQISSIFVTLNLELEAIKNRKRPSSGKHTVLQNETKKFDDESQRMLLESVETANQSIANIDGAFLLSTDRITNARSKHEIDDAMEFIEKSIASLEKYLQ